MASGANRSLRHQADPTQAHRRPAVHPRDHTLPSTGHAPDTSTAPTTARTTGTATASAANPSLHRPPARASLRWATTATTGASIPAARAPAWAVAPANTLTTSSRSKRHTIPALPHGRARAKPSSPTTPRTCGASQRASISASPMATSPNGPAARAHSASASPTVTQQVKRTYGLSTDGAEQRAITAALAAQCTPLTDSQSGTTQSSSSSPQTDAGSSVAGGSSEGPAPAGGANTQADPNQPQWCFTPPPSRVIALAPHLMDYCHDDSWRQLVPNN